MENPGREISNVIESLCLGSAQEQEDAINTYYLPNASFTHPFCRVPSFSKGVVPFAGDTDSRWLILGIFRWYRILSPRTSLQIDATAFDQKNGLLYVSMHQTLAIWFIPFYRAPVRLVTVLELVQKPSSESGQAASKNYAPDGRGSSGALSGPGQERAKYYILSQEDNYQPNDLFRFVLPGLGPFLWFLWQLYSTSLCVFLSLIFLPFFYALNKTALKKIN